MWSDLFLGLTVSARASFPEVLAPEHRTLGVGDVPTVSYDSDPACLAFGISLSFHMHLLGYQLVCASRSRSTGIGSDVSPRAPLGPNLCLRIFSSHR